MDKIEFEVLPDGTIKINTDRISGPNHGNAETLLREIQKEAGGSVKRVKKSNHHHHHHGDKDHVH